MSWIEAKVSGRWIDPDRLNPWRAKARRPPRARSAGGPVSDAENKLAWKLLGDYLRKCK